MDSRYPYELDNGGLSRDISRYPFGMLWKIAVFLHDFVAQLPTSETVQDVN